MESRDFIIVGAGPCGLSAAVELKKRGFNPLIIEKGCIANSIYGYPTYMHFFSTPELLEIGGLPFITQGEKPTRLEALKYYRAVANHFELNINPYETVTDIKREKGGFTVYTTKRDREKGEYRAQRIVVATGYFDNPNMIGIPGENLEKVHHYFKEAHPFYGQKVVVIGGKNSAVEAALELEQTGADVTMVYRRSAFTNSVKAWVKPVIESAIEKGRIRMYWDAHVTEIKPGSVIVEQGERQIEIPNDVVFALTGFTPDSSLLKQLGVKINHDTGIPLHDPDTMETNVPGVFIAGVLAAGFDANTIFIENGRFHGHAIAAEANKIQAGAH